MKREDFPRDLNLNTNSIENNILIPIKTYSCKDYHVSLSHTDSEVKINFKKYIVNLVFSFTI